MTSIYEGTEMDEDGNYVDVYRLSRRKLTARKKHFCDRCHDYIRPGEVYWRTFLMAGKVPYMDKWHADSKLCQALQCRAYPPHEECVRIRAERKSPAE